MADSPSSGPALLLARVGAIVLGVVLLSVLAFMTGAAIVLMRFTGVGIPWRDVFNHLGLTELLLIGVGQLVVFAVVGGVSALVVRQIDRRGTELQHYLAAVGLATVGVIVAILVFEAETLSKLFAAAATVIAAGLAWLSTGSRARGRAWRWVERRRRVVLKAAVLLAAVLVAVLHAAGEPWVVSFGAVAAVALLAFVVQLMIGRGSGPTARAVACVLALVVLLWLLIGWPVALLASLAAILVALLLPLFKRNATPRRHALYAFSSVLVFGFALVLLHTWREPDLQPIAVLLDGDTGVTGFLVTDTPEAVYVGSLRQCRRDPKDLVLKIGPPRQGSGQIRRIARTQISHGPNIGHGTSTRQLYPRAHVLLNDLRRASGLPGGPTDPVCDREGELDPKRRHYAILGAERARELAMKFRPVLRFDTEEQWRPLDVDRLLEQSGYDTRDLANRPSIDLPGEQLGGADYRSPQLDDCPPPSPPPLQDCNGGANSVIYYRAVLAHARAYIDYWWFFRYNHFRRYNPGQVCRSTVAPRPVQRLVCSEHEGDWEGVTAVSAVGEPDRLEFVGFAQHTGVFRRSADELRLENGRPVVYVADGSHASYSKACPKSCHQSAHKILHLVRIPEGDTDGEEDWARNGDDACTHPSPCLVPLPIDSWGDFDGFWGSRKCRRPGSSCVLATPPRSPSRQLRFRAPWCFTQGDGEPQCDTRRFLDQ
jgi:hypothetical protein